MKSRFAIWIILLAIFALVIFVTRAGPVAAGEALTPRQTRLEREIRSVKQAIGILVNHLRWLESTACGVGMDEFCEKQSVVSSNGEPNHDGETNLLGIYKITRYYTPMLNQERYLYEFKDRSKGCTPGNTRWLGYRSRVKGEYAADLCVNSSGDKFKTADGKTDLRLETPFRVAACPREMAFGTRLVVEGIGNVTCRDRGGAIRGKRLDIWAGIGDQAILDMKNSPGGLLNVYLLP